MLCGLSGIFGVSTFEIEECEEWLINELRSAAHILIVQLHSVRPTHISVERFQTIPSTKKRRGCIRSWILIIWIFAIIVTVSSLILSKDPLSYSVCCHLHSTKLHSLYAVCVFVCFFFNF